MFCFINLTPQTPPSVIPWLESYGSSLRHGKNKKIFFPPCEASDFRGRSQTDFLHDLEARHKRVYFTYFSTYMKVQTRFELRWMDAVGRMLAVGEALEE